MSKNTNTKTRKKVVYKPRIISWIILIVIIVAIVMYNNRTIPHYQEISDTIYGVEEPFRNNDNIFKVWGDLLVYHWNEVFHTN